MNILLASPRGFCAGVDRAILMVEKVLSRYGAPIYVRHEIVHNRYVVESLRQKGAVFVEEISEVPDDSTVIFSAHGVSQAVRAEAGSRGLRIFDATCPLVTKVHVEVARHGRQSKEVILIGHDKHPEVEGTLGQYDSDVGKIHLVQNESEAEQIQISQSEQLHYVTQTTLSVDETKSIISILKRRFPNIQGPRKKDDICYATQNRQDAVRELSGLVDALLVVGSENSSNSSRLRELGEHAGIPSYLVDDPKMVDVAWFDGVKTLGVTAGASAPEVLLESILEAVEKLTKQSLNVQTLPGKEENMHFALPRELREEEQSTLV